MEIQNIYWRRCSFRQVSEWSIDSKFSFYGY